jgi:hypothetical protein
MRKQHKLKQKEAQCYEQNLCSRERGLEDVAKEELHNLYSLPSNVL